MRFQISNLETSSCNGRIQMSEEPTLEAKVSFLSRPGSYPDPPRKVEPIETHMSWVFLTDRHAYKLKKPVRHDFLDFSSLAARKADCEAELRLNRRLAPNVYLGTVAMTFDDKGDLSLDAEGRVVDWLVKMRRLPRDKMLDQAIKAGTVDQADIRKVAEALAQFYIGAVPVEISPADYRARLQRDIRDNEAALLDTEYGLPKAQIRAAASTLQMCLDQAPDLFDRRVQEARIIEAHGDLRAEHVCLNRHPVFIDCLEFKRDFRVLDPLDELSFLALDCTRLGARWIGGRPL